MGHFSKTDTAIDDFIRSEIGVLRISPRIIEAPKDFENSIMNGVRAVEQKRATKWFVISFVAVSLLPVLARLLWHIVRHDYFAISSLPLGTTLVKIYGLAMSSAALAVFFVLGIAIANRIYLGAWLKVPLPIWKTK